jgi:hypothetical protein
VNGGDVGHAAARRGGVQHHLPRRPVG